MWLGYSPLTVIMIHILFMTLSFAYVHEPGNGLGVDGAKALVHVLMQMTQMTALYLGGKSPMTHAHTAVSAG